MADTVQQIKDRLSIVDVVGQYCKLQRAGQNYRALCPFHAERTPSFIVSPDRGTYHCFGCGAHGDIFSFIEAIEGVDFKGAMKMLAERAGVPLVFSGREKREDTDRLFEAMETAALFYQSKLTDEAKKYLKERGLREETIRAFRLGWASDAWSDASDHLRRKKFTNKEIVDAGLAKKPASTRDLSRQGEAVADGSSTRGGGEKASLTDKFRNRIMFPIFDTAGRVVAFSGRTFGEKAHPDAPKYLNSPETALYHKSRILYGFDRAKQSIRKHNFAVLVEGQMDLVMSHQAGWSNTVAVSGTAFTPEHAALLKRMSENLVIALDPDEAGFKAASRAARAALQQGMNVKVAQLPKGLDPADLIVKEGAEAWRAAIRGAKDIITFLLDVLQENAKTADQFRRSVESIVLPFLADVQSPIAREQYQKEIAKRLGVSESAVEKTTTTIQKSLTYHVVPRKEARPADAPNRIKQAYGLLLWQETLQKPMIDTDVFARELEGAIGKEHMDELRRLPLDDKETLRFFAEQLHGRNSSLQQSAKTLLAVLRRDKLQTELQETTAALRAAEAREDMGEIERLSEEARTLTTVIAQLTEK
ncbi:MAG TPA: DNA primase [Candidatus Paceibacterota bacterium]|nr:DNA primase [Candidatus Paceibacterota bacterium]